MKATGRGHSASLVGRVVSPGVALAIALGLGFVAAARAAEAVWSVLDAYMTAKTPGKKQKKAQSAG